MASPDDCRRALMHAIAVEVKANMSMVASLHQAAYDVQEQLGACNHVPFTVPVAEPATPGPESQRSAPERGRYRTPDAANEATTCQWSPTTWPMSSMSAASARRAGIREMVIAHYRFEDEVPAFHAETLDAAEAVAKKRYAQVIAASDSIVGALDACLLHAEERKEELARLHRRAEILEARLLGVAASRRPSAQAP